MNITAFDKKKSNKIKKLTMSFLSSVGIAKNEKDIENAYRAFFTSLYPSSIISPVKCDGMISCSDFSSIFEFKFNKDFRNKLDRADVILQSIIYLKKIYDKCDALSGDIILPKSIFIGDRNECFCLPVKNVSKYFSKDINWSLAASKGATHFPELIKEIANDDDVIPFIYELNDHFTFEDVIYKLSSINKGDDYVININSSNITKIYECFCEQVFKTVHKNSVDVFITCLTDRLNTYLHPNKKDVLCIRGEEVKVHPEYYRAFFSHFKQEYTPSELEFIVASKDRILEEQHRRRTGAYFTPAIWVDEAHKMLSENLGENWKDEYVVWDCACGTGNLTRDYQFKELYLSTLEKGDVDTIKDMNYNSGCCLFQYDFLGEMGIDKVPDELKKAFADGKKVLFFINPPYMRAGNYGTEETDKKSGAAKTEVNKYMLTEKIGHCSSNLYAQFIYKIIKLKELYPNISLSIFCPPSYRSSESFKNLIKLMDNNIQFKDGMLFQASHFADVKSQWGISFMIWNNNDNSNDVVLKVKDISQKTFEIETIGHKTIYYPMTMASKWVREEIRKETKIDSPQLTSAIKYLQEGKGRISKDSLGYFNNDSNNIHQNLQKVGLFSSASSHGQGLLINGNFNKVIALYAARKTVQSNWINWQDEYMIPDVSHQEYPQWNNDCIVYSLFNSKSNQSSLRSITYRDKLWNIENHFFFMSNDEIKNLANAHSFNECYQDCKKFPKDRYVFEKLSQVTLSKDAQEVLDKARELIRKSFPFRKLWHEENPEYHLSSWDAGWAQIKPFLKKYFKEDYDEFVRMYKAFENRMREGVYKFGFLYK